MIVNTLVSHKAESILLSSRYPLSADQFGLDGELGVLPLSEGLLVAPGPCSFSCGGIA